MLFLKEWKGLKTVGDLRKIIEELDDDLWIDFTPDTVYHEVNDDPFKIHLVGHGNETPAYIEFIYLDEY